MDPTNGYIKAWVGGMNYRHFQYDMVKKGKRQIGSTFKPFVYAAAIDQLKLSPCDTFPIVNFVLKRINLEMLNNGVQKFWRQIW